jgi:hypothetical protein
VTPDSSSIGVTNLRGEGFKPVRASSDDNTTDFSIVDGSRVMRNILGNLMKNQSGQAVLVNTLILVAVGALVMTPLLRFMVTGVKSGQTHEEMTLGLYGADAGVEDALWQMQYDESFELPAEGGDVPWQLPKPIDDRTVDVDVSNEGGGIYKITSTATSIDGGSTTIESYVEITAGGNLLVFDGALTSKGDISLGKDSRVIGDIYYGGTFTYGSGFVHIDGEEIQCGPDDFPSQEDDEAFAQKLKDEALEGGTSPSLTIDSDTELGPAYINGDLYISADIALNLTGTVYVEGSITAKMDYTVTGEGSIVAVGDIYMSKLADYGTEGNSVIMSVAGDITFKKEAIVEALIYAPNGTIAFDKTATIIGAVVGANIQADKQGFFTYVPRASEWEFPGSDPGGLQVKSYTINP